MPRLLAATLCLAASLCVAQTPAPPVPQLSFADQITQILSATDVARDHWGIYVTALDGTPIFALNEAQLFQPASNAKLFTTAAALALLGPDRTLTTRITGALDPTTGIVRGDLNLIGAGDANLDSQDLPYVPPATRPKPPAGQPPAPHQTNPMHDINDLVAQLVAKGVKQITGDIVGDNTLFPWEPYPGSWSIDDAVWGYGAPVSALTIADNELRLSIAPGTAAGQPAFVTLEQAVPYYTVQNETQTVTTKAEATGVQITRTIGSRTLRLYGSIALKDEPDVEHVAIEDPAEYAAMVLRATLVERGIAVTGTVRVRHRALSNAAGFITSLRNEGLENPASVAGALELKACPTDPLPPGIATLAAHTSQPLAADLVFTNKVSQNLHAELLLHHLGRHAGCRDGSTLEGARMVRTFLIVNHLDPNDFIFFDGSGLSGHDLVTPRATVRLLSFATGQPWFSAWRASLPVAGEDGSLTERFSKPPLKDHVFAKTGTLSEARALSGYLDAASGHTVIFSVMVGNHLPGTTADRDAMDKIVAAIQASE
jgi:D-alanyl-D-alanine carboxypeptidase/D-alanyl-D-alanine-endopeptidase (penicillin-binding protein 4)